MTESLAVRKLRKSHGAVEAVRDANPSILQGEVHSICGDNGAGRSALIKLISGVDSPDDGVISLRGKPGRCAAPSMNAQAVTKRRLACAKP